MPPQLDMKLRSILPKTKKLALSDPDDEIVITGVSGAFPESSNVLEFRENLLAKTNLISKTGQKCKAGSRYIDFNYGKLGASLTKFDAEFFRTESQVANELSPMVRILLEKTFEAIVDAGYNPEYFKGSNTAVYVALYNNECGMTWPFEKETANNRGFLGNMRFFIPNKISNFFGFQGPSYAIDSACTSSISALENAVADIRNGVCENAIIGGCNLCLNSSLMGMLCEMGVGSKSTTSKCFDESADGFLRAECIAAIFLQKTKHARRVYAKVVHVKTNSNGIHRTPVISEPSEEGQTDLFRKFYDECGVSPLSVNFVEAHATGTREGDLKEALAIENVFCPGRKEPLKIGSVKSNMGHGEAASGLCSIAKVILGYELGVILPNINFKTPRADIEAFRKGKLRVVTEPTPWIPSLAAVNNFGLGGVNGHVLLSPNLKEKFNGGLPTDDIPRLVAASGRNEEAVDTILKDIENRPLDVEYIHLFHQIYASTISGHEFRGYTLVEKDKQTLVREIEPFTSRQTRQVWFIFSGEGTPWSAMGKSLMALPLFRESIYKCHKTLVTRDVNLIDIFANENPNSIKNISDLCLGHTAMQIALYDVLTTIGIKPDGFVGYSGGEIACAYADGCLTLEQAILASYYRNKVLMESELIHGAMASVGLDREELKDLLPPEIDIACFNGSRNCIISGPSKTVNNFINDLRVKKIYAEEIDVLSIPYHSRYLMKTVQTLRAHMEQIISKRKPRSEKWISTSSTESKWKTDEVKYAGPEYYINNLLNPVYFEEAIRHIPDNALVIDIATSGPLQKILIELLGKRTIHFPLIDKNDTKGLQFFLRAIGRMFTAGLNPVLHKLYPPVTLPVGRGTPMISPLIKWEHSKDWFVTSLFSKMKKSGEHSVTVSLANPEVQYLSGHVIDGRNLYPAAGYLMLVWEKFALMQDKIFSDVSVVFENVKFVRATVIPIKDEIEFKILLHKSNGYFEVMEREGTVATGHIYELKNTEVKLKLDEKDTIPELPLKNNDVYKEFNLRGYNYEGIFQGITGSSYDGTVGRIKWENNFVPFLDSILQMSLFDIDWRTLFIPVGFRKLTINTKKHFSVLSRLEIKETPEFNAHFDREMKSIKCGGVEVQHLNLTSIARKKIQNEANVEKVVIIPFIKQWSGDFWEALTLCAGIISRNTSTTHLKILEYVNELTRTNRKLVSETLVEICKKYPLTQTHISVVFNKANHSLSQKNLLPGTDISYGELPNDKSKSVVVAANVLKQKHVLTACFNCVGENGFVLSIENAYDNVSLKGVNICMDHVVGEERFLLLRKVQSTGRNPKPLVVQITENSFCWVPQLQNCLKMLAEDDKLKLILYSENELSGIVGLTTCLIKEVGVEKIRCISIMDNSAPAFSVNHPFYKSQVCKDLVLQVYKDGKWGTYVNIPLELSHVKTPYVIANTLTVGDLSSLGWLESPLNSMTDKPREDTALVYVHYSALNFRDVMLATGKIPRNVVVKSRLEEEFVQGMEYSGKTADGQRVMGIVPAKAMATLVEVDTNFMLSVPDSWSLEEAATVPVVYATVLYALLLRGQLKKGCSILIHAGSGGVGQAAIHFCHYYGCTIFTTVGTQEKRNFIKETFPYIPGSHIGSSRDTSFERMIKKETKGRGVDIVLNSLAEEKLQASVNCLAHGGQFLEIGLYDLVMNNPLGMEHFLKEITFHGIELASLFYAEPVEKRKLKNVLQEFIDRGCIRPLTKTVFSTSELEAAFRFMAAGKHIGKVLLRMKNEESLSNQRHKTTFINAIPRYYCSENKSYVVCGGLGGIGLELVDWLVIRGARKLVISSRRGAITGYQKWKIRVWKSYGAVIVTSAEDITRMEGVENLLKTAAALGPVAAIFNLAVTLHDSLFENHTEASFAIPFGTKATATLNLDLVSRELCPNLEHFVVFSSVISNYGNAGQTNYGMSNSVMERICERRKSENLPALAIQCGPIGDVGVLNATHLKQQVLSGLNVEPVVTILEKLDYFLKQQNPVVLFASVAQNQSSSDKKRSILDIVTEITGIRNLQNINMNATLLNYGLDSMTIVELAQTCEREFDLFLTTQDLKTLTIGKLYELHQSVIRGKGSTKSNIQQEIPLAFEEVEVSQLELELSNLVKSLNGIRNESSFVIQLPSLISKEQSENYGRLPAPTIFILPGLDGNVNSVESLSLKLKARVLGLSYGYKHLHETVQECATRMIEMLADELAVIEEFYIVGYSYGALVAVEMVKILESEGKTGLLYLIDPVPDYAMTIREQLAVSGEQIWREIKKQLVSIVLQNFWTELPGTLIARVQAIDKWDEVVDCLAAFVPLVCKYENSKEFLKLCLDVAYFRLKQIVQYKNARMQIPMRSLTTLLIPTKSMFTAKKNNWSQNFSLPVNVREIESNYFEILNHADTAEIIMEDFNL